MISNAFNGKFNATLSDILDSEKTINIESGGIIVKIDTRKIDLNGLKIIFKTLDTNYPRKKESKKIKTKLSEGKLKKLYSLFGIPKSITEVTSAELSGHLMWIQSVCADNNIKIHDDVWDALLEKAIQHGY
jgi:hypothetical protein